MKTRAGLVEAMTRNLVADNEPCTRKSIKEFIMSWPESMRIYVLKNQSDKQLLDAVCQHYLEDILK